MIGCYNSEVQRFKEALDYLEEAAKISPENENVKKMLPQVKAVMK